MSEHIINGDKAHVYYDYDRALDDLMEQSE
jgi:hypothetical protein